MFPPKYLLIIIVAVLVLAVWVYGKQNSTVSKSTSLISEVLSPNPSSNFVDFKIKDNISYKLPEAWKSMKEYPSSANNINQNGNSVPYIHNVSYAYEGDHQNPKTDSIRLSIEVLNKSVKEYLDISQYKDGEDIQIDGKSAVKSHYDDSNQGHFLEYRFIHKGLPWKIWIQTKDLNAEKGQQKEINSFIDSIKLLEK